ncbi:IPExxxVDY family protein [Compostibacter hankyongensis]|uniref:IPExxxVDY family protein n=1 Tax=Compostibacter hankyongensis TaxID=1007089 RepID=A0ABP8FE48_9BACT
MSKGRFTLNTALLEEDFFDMTWLIGILAPIADYRLCWQLNRALGVNFRVNNDLEISLISKGKKCYFTVFEFTEPVKSVAHYLYNNHSKAEFLLPELRNIDYLWLLKGDYYRQGDVQELMERIRRVEGVQLVNLLDPAGLKHRQHLIF